MAFVLGCSCLLAPERQETGSSLWFDPTQLPAFTGAVDRYLPDPDGRVDQLVLKEGL